MMKRLCILLLLISTKAYGEEWFIPIQVENRKDVAQLKLTQIGAYGIIRRARPNIPSHLHTGIDIKRPNSNYDDEPVLPACIGKVISIRDDGPFAQIIIEHNEQWSVYEHISGIRCRVGDIVDPHVPIARFFNRSELSKYGLKFDHFHFEIMRARPVPAVNSVTHPNRYFDTYALVCYDESGLANRYYDPLDFLHRQQNNMVERGVSQ